MTHVHQLVLGNYYVYFWNCIAVLIEKLIQLDTLLIRS